LPSPGPHNKHSNIQYQFLSISPSPDPHNTDSKIQYQFLSIFPSPDPSNKHSNIHYHFLLSLHITAARHDNKTDCGVGCCWQHLLLYFEVTKISQQVLPTAVLSCHFTQFLQYNHRPLLTTLLPSSVPRSAQQVLCLRLHKTCLR